MSNFIFFALFIGATIVVKFFYDWNKQKSKITLEGGVVKKYALLINQLKGDEKPQVFQLDKEIYSFGWITPNADNRFTIIENFGAVIIKWNFKALIVSEKVNLTREWRFQQDCDQAWAAKKILSEMEAASNEMF